MKSKGSILSVMVALVVGISLVTGYSEPKFGFDPLKENQAAESAEPAKPAEITPAPAAPVMSTPTVVPVEVVKATVPEKVANSNGSGMATTIASVIPKAGSNGTESELSANLLRAGDEIVVNFSDTPTPILPLSITVKDDGTVTIIYNQSFQAAGKTLGALQNDIHERYVPVYFKFLTVNLTTQRRFFTVGGEVKSPNRYEYSGKMTVLGAIATSGGFTDFSKKGKIQVTRSNGKTIMVDGIKALKNSELNIEIFPGDRIDVEKRGF